MVVVAFIVDAELEKIPTKAVIETENQLITVTNIVPKHVIDYVKLENNIRGKVYSFEFSFAHCDNFNIIITLEDFDVKAKFTPAYKNKDFLNECYQTVANPFVGNTHTSELIYEATNWFGLKRPENLINEPVGPDIFEAIDGDDGKFTDLFWITMYY
jgi:hypothetical protein